MKVTLIGTLPPIKALSPYCFHLAEALSEKIDVEFISIQSILPDFLYYGGTRADDEIIYIPKNVQTRNLLKWYNPITWIKAGVVATGDVVHVQQWAFYSSAMYCIILPVAKIRGKKRILTIHNVTPHVHNVVTLALDKILNKMIFSFASGFIIHNMRNKEKLISLYGIDEQKIFIITHGTLHTFHQISGISQEKARAYLKIPQEKKVILFFGYLWGYKGLDVLLTSLSIVKKTLNDVIVLIAGQPLKDWKHYEKIIRDYDLENNVIKHLQYISDQEIEQVFSCADLVVLPYKKEPFDTHGGVGALALSFQKPLLVTDVGGLPEYVKDKRMIVHPDDAEELASRIVLVLRDPALLQKLSKDSEELARELNWDTIAEKTLSVYHSALE